MYLLKTIREKQPKEDKWFSSHFFSFRFTGVSSTRTLDSHTISIFMRSSESQLLYLEVNPGDKSLLLTSCLSLIADSPRSRLVKYPLMLRSIQKYVSTAMTRAGGISGCFPCGMKRL